jgi:hypothetical protein
MFAHCHDTGVREVHRLIRILDYQFLNTRVIFTEIPRTHQQSIPKQFEDEFWIGKQMRRLHEDSFACHQRMRQASHQIPRPLPKLGFSSVQRGDQRSGIEQILHLLFRCSLNARRTFALVGGETIDSAFPKYFSHGEPSRALARWRTAFRTNSATLSFASAAAFSHSAFSSAGTRMESMSLMSAVSHSKAICQFDIQARCVLCISQFLIK